MYRYAIKNPCKFTGKMQYSFRVIFIAGVRAMIRIFGSLFVMVLTFSVGVFLTPSPAILSFEKEARPLSAPAISDTPAAAEPYDILARNGNLQAIELKQLTPGEQRVRGQIFDDLSSQPLDIELDVREDWDGELLILHPFHGDSREFRIEEQYETSMSVFSDVGPEIAQLDLTGWKHYTSGWSELKNLGENKFLVHSRTAEENRKFPAVTRKEIYETVVKREGKWWGEIAKTCKSADSRPCFVWTSRRSFRVFARIHGKWTVIHRIDTRGTLGC
jgi:hypothetical protein